jgi:formylglycine-generating enzyme required for sulfatase activity
MKKLKLLMWVLIALMIILIYSYFSLNNGIIKIDGKKIEYPAGTNKETKIGSDQSSKKLIIQDCNDCVEMIVIPAGSFEMGETGHTHHVTISKPFAIGKYEVTQAQWLAIMGHNPSHFQKCGVNCPVEQVCWDDIQQFIRKLNHKTGKRYRLPSESEWEYACRAGGRNEYCGSNNMSSISWNEVNETHPVGLKQANAFGLYDMSGNVWEWVEDTWHEDYNGAPANGSAWTGDTSYRVLRGGTWFSLPSEVSASSRGKSIPPQVDAAFGFRLAQTLQ